jgi:hypothetical protein
MTEVTITIPPSHGSSDRWDTFGMLWDDSTAYWSSSWEEDEVDISSQAMSEVSSSAVP